MERLSQEEFRAMPNDRQFHYVIQNCHTEVWPRFPFMPLIKINNAQVDNPSCGFLLAHDIKTLDHAKVYVGIMLTFGEDGIRFINDDEIKLRSVIRYDTVEAMAQVWQIDD